MTTEPHGQALEPGPALRRAEIEALRQMAAGAPLEGILEVLVRAFEGAHPGSVASILLVDPETRVLLTGAAPSLPPAYNQAIHGLSIGPTAGSCGTAAFRGETVVVSDIATDPLWAPYRPLAEEHGLRACWSIPVRGSDGQVLATFAVYYREPRSPGQQDLALVTAWSHLVGVAVGRARADEDLRRSQALLRMASEVSRVGAWQVDLPGHRPTWSDQACALFGRRPASLEELFESYAPECRSALRRDFAACTAEGRRFDRELRLATGAWVRTMGQAVRDGEGRIVRLQGAVQDISERREVQENLRTLAQRLLDTLESIDSAFYMLDREWRFVFLNAEAERLLRRRRQELLGTIVWEEFSEAVGTPFHREFLHAVEEGVTVTVEEYYPPLECWFEVRAHPTPDGLAVYFRDVTRRHDAERRLRQQATLLDAAQDAILVRGLDHRVRYWNRGAERLYGWSAEEALGRSVEDLLYADPTGFRQATEEVNRLGEWMGELEQITRAGELRVVECRWTLMPDAGAILCINTDVTKRRQLEQQVMRARRMESLGTLAGGIAHDLNNVLSPILMALRILKDEETDAGKLRLLDAVEVSAERGADMVAQVLSFARGVEGRRVPVDVEAVLGELISLARETFPKGIRLVVELVPPLRPLRADPTQLHQVLLNLFVNARDAMPDGGTLVLRAENLVLDEHFTASHLEAREGPYLRVEVIDTGCGIPREHLERVFDPFFTTKAVGQGTGLGLSTTLAIVRSHGGFMQVYSEPGQGTRFCVYLPLPADAATGDAPEPDELPRGHGERILVVDDEASLRQITCQTLEAYGYQTLAAADGAEAVALFAERGSEVAAVLTDMAMPGLDGPATIQALRDLDPQVRILGASGWMADPRRVENLRHFLPKPCTAERLLRTLREVLDDA